MASNPIVGQVWQLAEPLCLSEGMELVHLEYQREPGGRTMRLYLDRPQGVTLDDCANISRQLGDILDVSLDAEGAYRLEVSSPGLQRPLGKLSDFMRFKGRKAKVRMVRPLNGRKNFTGILDGIDDLFVRINVDQKIVAIPFAEISKAHLINQNGETACS